MLATLGLIALTLAGCGEPAPDNSAAAGSPAANVLKAPAPVAETARVRLETEEGPITVELDGRRAPVATANFLRYVDEHRFDGIAF